MIIYELSRDYARAWELIQQGDRLACWVDADADEGKAYPMKSSWFEIALYRLYTR